MPPHVEEQPHRRMAIVVMAIAGDHGIVANGVPHAQWGPVKYLPRQLQTPRASVRGDQRRPGDDVRLGNSVEQVAGVADVRGLAVNVDQAVDDVAAGLQPGGDHVGVDGAGRRVGGGCSGAASPELSGEASGDGSDVGCAAGVHWDRQ